MMKCLISRFAHSLSTKSNTGKQAILACLDELSALFGMGKLFCKIRYWYPIQERVGSEWFRAKKKYYSLYDTFGDFGKLK